MPRPNPPRKRPRRRPDAVERGARAEVTLARQEAEVKEKNGAADSKRQSSARVQPAKARPALTGSAARAARLNEPYIPWAQRSYAIFFALMALGELVIGGLTYFTYSGSKPPFWVFVVGGDAGSLGPVVAVAAALVAAQLAKRISKESRPLRFMESAIAGVVQYSFFFIFFVGILYILGPESNTAASKAVTTTEPIEVAGLAVADVLSFVAAYFVYPPLYRRLRVKPPRPRTPRVPKADARTKGPKSAVDAMDEAPNKGAKDAPA
jgi:hypothetical protein